MVHIILLSFKALVTMFAHHCPSCINGYLMTDNDGLMYVTSFFALTAVWLNAFQGGGIGTGTDRPAAI